MPLLGTYLVPMWITTWFLYTFTMTPRCEFITGTWEIVRLSRSTVHCIIMFGRRNISAKSIMQLRVLSFWTFLSERWRHYWDLLVCITILISCFALFVPFVSRHERPRGQRGHASSRACDLNSGISQAPWFSPARNIRDGHLKAFLYVCVPFSWRS